MTSGAVTDVLAVEDEHHLGCRLALDRIALVDRVSQLVNQSKLLCLAAVT